MTRLLPFITIDCGHPCETNTLHLRDERGRDNLVLADAGCRNTVFNAEAQSGLPFIEDFMSSGIASYRVELVDEPSEVVAPLLKGYRDVLLGRKNWREHWKYVSTIPDANGRSMGVSEGSLVVATEQTQAEMKQTAYQLKQERDKQASAAAPTKQPVRREKQQEERDSSSARSSARSPPRRGASGSDRDGDQRGSARRGQAGSNGDGRAARPGPGSSGRPNRPGKRT